MITPLILHINNPTKFKIINDYNFQLYSRDYIETKYVYDCHNDNLIETTNIDQPNIQFILKNKFNNYYIRFNNRVEFEIPIHYEHILKSFKINNSSWATLALFEQRVYDTGPKYFGEIIFLTPLDMIQTCNIFFTNIINSTITFYAFSTL